MAQQIQHRRDSAADWTTFNPVLAAGEIGVELDTGKIKVGNGTTAWSALSYIQPDAVLSVNGLTGAVVLNPDNLDDTSSVNKFVTAADLTKLAGIEAGADVTDAINVAAAGAVMDTGDETIAGIKTFSASPIVPTPTTNYQASTKKYVDDSVAAGGGGGGLSVRLGGGAGYDTGSAVTDAQAFGYSNATAASSFSKVYGSLGSLAFGRALASHTGSNGYIEATADGALAHGRADGADGGSGFIKAQGKGSLAGGYAEGDRIGPYTTDGRMAGIYASAAGSTARGFARATGGYGANDVSLRASGAGAVAFGYAFNDDITASGKGSGAFGYAVSGSPIAATANNSFQFGPGSNAVANSVKVGAGPRICGEIPAAPANGDIWVDGTGNVIIRSGGISVTIA